MQMVLPTRALGLQTPLTVKCTHKGRRLLVDLIISIHFVCQSNLKRTFFHIFSIIFSEQVESSQTGRLHDLNVTNAEVVCTVQQ